MFARPPLPPLPSDIGCMNRLRVRQDHHGERHGFFPFQTIRSTLPHPGVEHLRPAVRGIVVVVQPSRVCVVGRSSERYVSADDPPPQAEGYQAEKEDTDADEADKDGRRCGRGRGSGSGR